MKQNQKDSAKKYSRIKEYIRLISIPYDIIFLLLMIFFLSQVLLYWVGSFTDIRYLKIPLYGTLFLILSYIFKLPLNFYSGYILEHKFKLSKENISGWFKFEFKSILLSLLLGIPLLTIFYYILDNYPSWWWIIAATCFFIVSLIISYIFPFIIPFFYKLEPLDNEELKSKIKEIIEKGRLQLKGVYRIKLGGRTKKANAALVGFGKTKKVLLSDTLIESDFSQEEIASVTAHETGHFVYHHIWKLIFIQALLSYGFFYIIFHIIDNIIRLLSYGEVNDIINFPVILLNFSILNLIIEPATNFFSRLFEYKADSYAVSVTDRENFISSLRNLAKINLVDKNPPRLLELLFHSHPSIERRIKNIRKINLRC